MEERLWLVCQGQLGFKESRYEIYYEEATFEDKSLGKGGKLYEAKDTSTYQCLAGRHRNDFQFKKVSGGNRKGHTHAAQQEGD